MWGVGDDTGVVPDQDHHHLPIGPTVVAGGHVELDEEVTNQLTRPLLEALKPETSGWGCLGCGLREGQTKDLKETCAILISSC